MELSILFNNINQMMIYYGRQDTPWKKIQGDPDVDTHVDSFKPLNQTDITGLAEVIFDNKNGDSAMLDDFSQKMNLPYVQYEVNGPCYKDVDAIQGKYYGQAILSRHPILSYERHEIFEPDCLDTSTFSDNTIDDGSEKHRKFVQKVILDVEGQKVTAFSLHSIPFHLFKKDGEPLSIDDPDMQGWRDDFANMFSCQNDENVVIMGDFNNMNFPIEKLLPHLFETGTVKSAIQFDRHKTVTVFDRNATQKSKGLLDLDQDSYTSKQVDHILVSKNMTPSDQKILITPSDHPALFTKITF